MRSEKKRTHKYPQCIVRVQYIVLCIYTHWRLLSYHYLRLRMWLCETNSQMVISSLSKNIIGQSKWTHAVAVRCILVYVFLFKWQTWLHNQVDKKLQKIIWCSWASVRHPDRSVMVIHSLCCIRDRSDLAGNVRALGKYK